MADLTPESKASADKARKAASGLPARTVVRGVHSILLELAELRDAINTGTPALNLNDISRKLLEQARSAISDPSVPEEDRDVSFALLEMFSGVSREIRAIRELGAWHAAAGLSSSESDQNVLPVQAYSRRMPVPPRLKAGPNVFITQRADEFEIDAPPNLDQSVLASRIFASRPPVGNGDVKGPPSSIRFSIPFYDDASGKLLGYLEAGFRTDALGNIFFDPTNVGSIGIFFGGSPIHGVIVLTPIPDGGGIGVAAINGLLKLQGVGEIELADHNTTAIILDLLGTALAENYLEISNSDPGDPLPISARGTDANIDIDLAPKGDGRLTYNGAEVATILSGQVFGG